MKRKTAVLLIGFGGPTSMAELRPFLDSVLEGVKIPAPRLDEVIRHYEVFKGVSPYNDITRMQKEALEKWFVSKGEAVLVYIGLRHASPAFKETWEVMKGDGIEQVIGFVLSPFRCFASFEKYLNRVEEGRALAGATMMKIEYTDAFFKDPLFHESQGDKIRSVLDQIPSAEHQRTFFLFSAHSIPRPMSDESGYANQFFRASAGIAEQLGLAEWGCGYQSRSGNPRDPWLIPDVKDVLKDLDRKKYLHVVLVPVGFLSDNMEVLYDLDVEAKEAAESFGFRYFRASTVTDHPRFIELIGTQTLQKLCRSSVCR